MIPDLRFIIDFHWAISCLLGGRSSCRDDRSANEARFDRGDGDGLLPVVRVNGAIGSSCIQKPSSASSESTAAVTDDESSSASASHPPPPPAPDVRSSDNTNRLEFLRCCIMSCRGYFVGATEFCYWIAQNDDNYYLYASCTASISRPR